MRFEDQHCDNCRFKVDKDCARYPPTVFRYVDSDGYAEFLSVYPDAQGWCGEWSEMPLEPVAVAVTTGLMNGPKETTVIRLDDKK